MYEEFYGLTEKPFSIQPDPAFLYWGRGHRLAYAMLEYGVVNQAGISVITGEVGCGKTTLIHRLLDQLSDTHTIALLSNIQAGRGDLLSWVLMGFGEPYAGKTHVELFSQLQSFFIREYARGKRVVLIIDEAQNLSIDMLEEIRMLSNINAGKDQLLQLILVGQPQLKDLLSRPDMLQLAQRIGSDFHLTPLTREEVRAYIETRLSIAGAQRNVFTPESMDLIAEQSRGVPRVINTIADTALVYAFSAQDDFVSEEIVRSVIRDKVDYGVFGLASSPELKLAEGGDGRRASSSGFLRAEPKPDGDGRDRAFVPPTDFEPERAAASLFEPPRSSPPRAAPRVDGEGGVRLLAIEPVDGADAEPPAERLAAPAFNEPRSAPARPRPAEPAVEPAPSPVALRPQQRPPAPVANDDLGPAPTASRAAPPAPAAPDPATADDIGVVVVSAEGGLLESVLAAPPDTVVVAVALAGSEDAKAAREAGLELVELDAAAFSGGRARNAGYRRLKKIAPSFRFVQFVDGGAEIDPGWFATAARFMARRPEVAVAEGRTAERAAAASSGSPSIFLGAEEEKPKEEGEVQAAGSTALFRADAFEAAGGFRGDIIADETADLCIRLRRRGAHVWRCEETMAKIPAKDPSFAAWRRRAERDGYAYAAGAALHGGPPERYRATDQARAVMWGAVFPAMTILAALLAAVVAMMLSGVNPFALALSVLAVGVLIYAAKIAAMAAADGFFALASWRRAAIRTLRHFYEFAGVRRYWFSPRKGAGGRKALA